LHTNDAPGGVTRMVDMGIESYLVAATVLGIMAQRLVRMVCEACAEEIAPDADVLATVAAGQAKVAAPRFRRGRGCEVCSGTGYRGRTGLYELMPMTPELREGVVQGAPLARLRAMAESHGMTSLRTSGWIKACEGVTTLEEVMRISRDEIA
jgi:type II secretory ATPase GspE/PulE/Tfp pilus assembly ATPase PilB-like protein